MAWNFKVASGLAVVALAALPILTNGCSSSANPLGDVCCTDFKPGTDMASVKFTGDAAVNGQFVAFAQAAGDVSAVAAAAVSDVTGACMHIATDLGDDPAAGNGKTGQDALNFWCGEATAKINAALTASGSAKLTLTFDPPKCTASIQAQASCQGSCDVNAKCDIKANPPKCTGGTLQIDCKGSCTADATAPTIECTGSCTGNCSGSCSATGGVAVDCQGSCDGTCTVDGTASGASGVQADGSCKGKCQGTCKASATAPAVKCSGSCSGKCDAACKATPGQASVKCSGKCDADYQPLSCEGGKLEGGCQVDAKCQANCNASASAKAECTPPQVKIAASVQAGTGQIDQLIATLEANLPALLVVVQARGQAFVDSFSAVVEGGATVAGSGKLDVKGTACLVAAGAAATQAVADFKGALSASINVTGAVGAK